MAHLPAGAARWLSCLCGSLQSRLHKNLQRTPQTGLSLSASLRRDGTTLRYRLLAVLPVARVRIVRLDAQEPAVRLVFLEHIVHIELVATGTRLVY